jgi:hypothetical protein
MLQIKLVRQCDRPTSVANASADAECTACVAVPIRPAILTKDIARSRFSEGGLCEAEQPDAKRCVAHHQDEISGTSSALGDGLDWTQGHWHFLV